MSAPATAAPAPAAAEAAAPAAAAADAAAASSVTSAAAAPAAAAPAALPPTDNLTKLMMSKALTMLSSHPAIASRGVGMLLRNFYGIAFGPQFAQSWENQIMREEQKNTKVSFQRTNEASLKRLAHFFTNKKVRAKSGSALALALLNPACKGESFEHRLTLVWLGGAASPRLFKIDGMKRDGVLGLTKEQTTWPVAVTECPEQGKQLWEALQVFITAGNPKSDWSREKADAFDAIIAQHGPDARSIPFASALSLKGQQVYCCITNDEEGLAIDLKNGFVERLKAIQMQLDAMK